MYNKTNLQVHKLASKHSIKSELASVAFYGNRTVATDSFRAIQVSANAEKHKPFLIKADLVKKLASDPALFHDLVDGLDKVDATFPDIDQVFENFEDGKFTEITLNAQYLEEVLSIMKTLDSFKKVTLRVPVDSSKQRPIIVEATSTEKNGYRQTAKALVMPLNK